MFLVLFFIICYDIATGNYNDVLLPNGQRYNRVRHRAAAVLIMVNSIVKIVQVVYF